MKPITIIADSPENNIQIQKLLNELGDNNIMVLDYTSVNIHFLARKLTEYPFSQLVIYDFIKFFSNPLLVKALKKALYEFPVNEFTISIPECGYNSKDEFSDNAQLNDDEPITFNLVETLAYIHHFNQKSDFSIETLDTLYDQTK